MFYQHQIGTDAYQRILTRVRYRRLVIGEKEVTSIRRLLQDTAHHQNMRDNLALVEELVFCESFSSSPVEDAAVCVFLATRVLENFAATGSLPLTSLVNHFRSNHMAFLQHLECTVKFDGLAALSGCRFVKLNTVLLRIAPTHIPFEDLLNGPIFREICNVRHALANARSVHFELNQENYVESADRIQALFIFATLMDLQFTNLKNVTIIANMQGIYSRRSCAMLLHFVTTHSALECIHLDIHRNMLLDPELLKLEAPEVHFLRVSEERSWGFCVSFGIKRLVVHVPSSSLEAVANDLWCLAYRLHVEGRAPHVKLTSITLMNFTWDLAIRRETARPLLASLMIFEQIGCSVYDGTGTKVGCELLPSQCPDIMPRWS
jgi:hypothetical protein